MSNSPPGSDLNDLIGLFNQGRIHDVVERGKHLASMYPHSDVIYHVLGAAYLGLGEFDQANGAFTRALEIKPDNADVHNTLGKALTKQGKLEEAVASYRRALAINPEHADAQNDLGAALKEQGKLDEAAAAFSRAVEISPDFALAQNNLGFALAGQDKFDEAVAAYRRALAIDPGFALAYNNLGNALLGQGKPEEASDAFTRSLAINPNNADVHNDLGIALARRGELPEAIASYDRALAINPGYADAHNNLGVALKEQGNLDEAVAAYGRALAINPDFALAHYNLGLAFKEQGNLDEALAAYDRALMADPNNAGVHIDFGVVLKLQGKTDEAAAAFRRALAIDPDFAIAHNNLGATLELQGKLDEAVTCYSRAFTIEPDYRDAHCNLGAALQAQGKFDEAEAAYRRAIAIDPDFADPHSNLGAALQAQGRLDEAVTAYRRAIRINPDYADAHGNLGIALQEQGKLDEAVTAYSRTLEIKPDHGEAFAQKVHLLAHMCDWNGVAQFRSAVQTVGVLGAPVSPFPLLSADGDPSRNRKRSEKWAQEKYKIASVRLRERPSLAPKQLKIGYFSADFHDHATMYLMAGLFNRHDRRRFNIYAYSYGATRSGEMREGLVKDVDCFTDVRDVADLAAADLVRNHELDIAIDLKGYTRHTRSGLFAYRLAPIQINYLGYPGTMGAPFIDYILSDKIIIPSEQRDHYSESVIYLPNSYQVNDDRRFVGEPVRNREALGLPQHGFVFCCFNNNYKITPAEFDIWMRLLRQLEGSVLWLLKANRWADANLRKEAQARGVDPGRLIFADFASQAEHLARQRHADLFLDTFNFNAHTTASDALWAGLPIVTKPGQGFAARVAASLLHAVGLPELVTQTEEEYEQLALALATDPARLSAVKAKLAVNRLKQPLFNTELSTRHIEAAYEAAYLRYFEGKRPDDIAIG